LQAGSLQAGSLQASYGSPQEVVDLDKTPIRISDEAVAHGFQTVKSLTYQSYLPEYPKTDNAGFGYSLNVSHLSPDDILQLHKQVCTIPPAATANNLAATDDIPNRYNMGKVIPPRCFTVKLYRRSSTERIALCENTHVRA
jgi:hypothetical protein